MNSCWALHGFRQTSRGLPLRKKPLHNLALTQVLFHKEKTFSKENREVERFMRTLNKILRIAGAKGKTIKQKLYTFLRYYRATPHIAVGIPSATTQLQMKLPDLLSSASEWPNSSKWESSKRKNEKEGKKVQNHKAGSHNNWRLCLSEEFTAKR